MTSPLIDMLTSARARYADRPALAQGDDARTYDELWSAAARVAATIDAAAASRASEPYVAFVGSRTIAAYENLLGIVLSGRGYLPLEPEQPAGRLAALVDQSAVVTVVADVGSLPLVAEICGELGRSLLVIATQATADELGVIVAAGSRAIGAAYVEAAAEPPGVAVASDDPLYLIFTSGSTGTPKGVVVEHRNMMALLAALRHEVDVRPSDVVVQLFKLAFDPSQMMTMFAWTAGAELVIPEVESSVLSEAGLITRHGVTIFGAVPSRTSIMRRLRQLKPDRYPQLRYVFQGGEALTTDDCLAWNGAAPNATVLNQYGPTEATVMVTQYRWDPARSLGDSDGPRVPIGYPLPGVEIAVVDPGLHEVDDGRTGELLVGGPQVARGYLGDAERTAAAFVTLPGRDGRFYRTGDLVRRVSPGAPLLFTGRADDQVKVLGRRIELGEVEAVVRATLGVPAAAAIGWPATPGGYDGIEVFVAGGSVTEEGRAELARRLPKEAVPRHVRVLDELPLTVNGKVDRRVLEGLLAEGRR